MFAYGEQAAREERASVPFAVLTLACEVWPRMRALAVWVLSLRICMATLHRVSLIILNENTRTDCLQGSVDVACGIRTLVY